MKKIAILILLAGLGIQALAQERSSFKPEDFKKDANYGYFNYFQLMVHSGVHPSGTLYLQDVFAGGFKAIEMRIGTQSTGRQSWQQVHNYPQYGLGFYLGDLGGASADTLIGSPSAVYFYFGAPWIRFGKFTLNTDLSIGLGYDFKPYDPVENPYNDVLASKVNLYFNLNLLLYYMLSERIDLSLGYGLTHFSNGRIATPQKGVNTLGVNLGVKYNLNPIKNYTKHVDPDYQPKIRPTFVKDELPEFKKSHEVQFMYAVGTVQTERPIGEPKGPRYSTSSLTVDYAYWFARRMKAAAGVDAFYDGSLAETYPGVEFGDVTTIQKMSFGTHVGFQYLIERFTFVFNLGAYVYKESPARGAWYMRAGGRIQLTDNVHAHICLKTMNGGVSDWIEWGASYYLSSKTWGKKK